MSFIWNTQENTTEDLFIDVHQADSQFEKRAYERFPSNLHARLLYGNMIYSGIVTNLSKKGMFVNTNVRFPVNTEFMILLQINNRTLKIPIKVRRAVKRESAYHSKTDCGIGVELLDAPQNYVDYVVSRKSSMQVSY
ncbi:MAG: PilZ domain-containing protein [Nitrospirota bacterium]